jgi:hypothetical protein
MTAVPYEHIQRMMALAATLANVSDPAAFVRWRLQNELTDPDEKEAAELLFRAGVEVRAKHQPNPALDGVRFSYAITGTTATLSGVSIGHGSTRIEAARNVLGKFLVEGPIDKRIAVALALGLDMPRALQFGGLN